MANAKKPAKPLPTKTAKAIPWHKELWVRIVGGITVIGAILTLIDTSTSLFDRFYHPQPKEILVDDLPIRVKYDKSSGLSIKARIPYLLRAKTYLVDYIDQDSIIIYNFKLENKKVIFTDSVKNSSLQLYPSTGYSSSGDETQNLHQVEYNFNIYLTLLPSIAKAKSGEIYDIGFAVFHIPYFVKGLRKVKEQKIPIELEVK